MSRATITAIEIDGYAEVVTDILQNIYKCRFNGCGSAATLAVTIKFAGVEIWGQQNSYPFPIYIHRLFLLIFQICLGRH